MKRMKALLIVYDNASHTNYFPLGLAYIAAVLEEKQVDVTIYNQDIHHFPEMHLTDYLNHHHFDIIGYGTVGGYFQYQKLISISRAINNAVRRPFFIIGGHGPSPEPEFFIKKTNADVVVMGEGESVISDLIDALENNKPLSTVQGIAYKDNGRVIVNKRRSLIGDIDRIPMPAYHLFPMECYRLALHVNASATDFAIPIISSRGCTFKCNFCYRMDKGLRNRSVDSIIEEIKFLIAQYRINYFIFYDELFMSSEHRTESLCESFIANHLNIKWSCSGRLNYAKPDLLKLMKRAGCVFINYGIESMDDATLERMNKHLTTEQISDGVKATIAADISPGLNVIFGNIDESIEVLEKNVDFLMRYSDFRQLRTIRPVTPYPGSPLYYHAIETGLLKDCEDFYENKHVNSDLLTVNFTRLSDQDFHHALHDANLRLLKGYFDHQLEFLIEKTHDLYLNNNTSFRGYRHDKNFGI